MKLVFLLFLVNFAAANICDLLNSDDEILMIGELKENILLITKAYQVMFIKKDTSVIENNILNAHKTENFTIDYAFPAFKNYKHFNDIKGLVHNGIIHYLEGTEYLELHTVQKIDKKKGIFYDIFKDLIKEGRWFKSTTDYFNLVSVYDENAFYGFSKHADGKSTIALWKYKNIKDFSSSEMHSFSKHGLCMNPKSERLEIYLSDSCEKYVDWGNKRGFIYNETVFLFDKTEVVIFPESLISMVKRKESFHSTKPHPVMVKSLRDFFECPLPNSESLELDDNNSYDKFGVVKNGSRSTTIGFNYTTHLNDTSNYTASMTPNTTMSTNITSYAWFPILLTLCIFAVCFISLAIYICNNKQILADFSSASLFSVYSKPTATPILETKLSAVDGAVAEKTRQTPDAKNIKTVDVEFKTARSQGENPKEQNPKTA